MEIQRQTSAGCATLVLRGRLDAAWCGAVGDALQQTAREGCLDVRLDFAGVSYVSSAGLRVLMAHWKELRRAQGRLAIAPVSPEAERVLRLAGLAVLLDSSSAAAPAHGETAPATAVPKSSSWGGASFSGDVETISPGARWRGRLIGERAGGGSPPNLAALAAAPLAAVKLPASSLALGFGAFGASDAECAPLLGEMLAAGGCAVCLPADGANRADFTVAEGALAPEARIAHGLVADGAPSRLARFEAAGEAASTPLAELAAGLLTVADAPQIAFAAVVECAALVGACLRRAPAHHGAENCFNFPAVRDWLTFTSEPAYANTVALLAGVLARGGGPLDDFTRPLDGADGPRGHIHAAAFTYRPIRHGSLALAETAAGLFDAGRVLGVLHLLADRRPVVGAGESRFYRGACWFGPLDL